MSGFPGTTLYSKRDACLKPTGVYLPGDGGISGRVDVIFWLHGWYVHDIQYLFRADESKVREQVNASGKNVVLVGPFFGHKKSRTEGAYDVGALGEGSGCQEYLDGVMKAVGSFKKVTPPGCRQPRARLLFGRRGGHEEGG